MRKVFTMIVAGLVVAACAPQPTPRTTVSTSDPDFKVCKEFGVLGGTFMAARQAGKSKETVRQAVLNANKPELENVALSLVDAAYKTPILTTEEEKKKAVGDFAVATTRICMKSLQDARKK